MRKEHPPVLMRDEDDEPPVKVAICMPAMDSVPAGYMFDMCKLSAFSAATLMTDGVADILHNMTQGTLVQAAREELAQRALATGCTHLLWTDTDMRFPQDSLLRLLNHNKDIVGINYPTRGQPPKYVAFKKVDWDGGKHTKLETKPEDSGLEEVEAIGFGLVLIRASVFWKLKDRKPWFDFEWVGPGAQWVGEDVYFCRKAREEGYKVYVDQDLSHECAHVGQFEYRLLHADAIRELREEEQGDNKLLRVADGG